MEHLLDVENKLNVLFPNSYKNILDQFKLFMEIEFKGHTIDLFNIDSLFENVNGFSKWNYMEYLVDINKEKQQDISVVNRHDENSYINSERVKKGFMFGSFADGVRLYFDLEDNLSIWEYWLDDGSIGKIADNFDEILSIGEISDFE
ncbi:SMI1/KNR4 family protein [Neisseria dumasiana]|uniref:SMI1/KNR4 family protein n=1 Tax=Neisseria dumasiana TaxID=1931275 RepID=A0A1X3DKN0_9NEIS|nr:SMI1/KNR4 family protein [Neisseria dumasiana]OSI24710.1 SMI1/KNR4 family protein [Neisseria dumasiana]